jgi:cysteinyl-tRNA synthetase
VLRALVVRLGELAEEGVADPAAKVAPLVEALLAVRKAAREKKDFATSDLVRERLAASGVEVRDTRQGTTWSLAGSP